MKQSSKGVCVCVRVHVHLCQVRSSSRKMFLLALRPPTGVRGSLGSSTHTEQGESDKVFRSSPMEPESAEWAQLSASLRQYVQARKSPRQESITADKEEKNKTKKKSLKAHEFRTFFKTLCNKAYFTGKYTYFNNIKPFESHCYATF